MTDLFGDIPSQQNRVYRRDSVGRFANEKTARYDKAIRDADKYRQMYEVEKSRTKGLYKLLHIKDELINKLQNK